MREFATTQNSRRTGSTQSCQGTVRVRCIHNGIRHGTTPEPDVLNVLFAGKIRRLAVGAYCVSRTVAIVRGVYCAHCDAFEIRSECINRLTAWVIDRALLFVVPNQNKWHYVCYFLFNALLGHRRICRSQFWLRRERCEERNSVRACRNREHCRRNEHSIFAARRAPPKTTTARHLAREVLRRKRRMK